VTSIFRIDHRDRDIGAPDHAVNIGHLELLQDVLRGVTGLPLARKTVKFHEMRYLLSQQ
jgi:hypothetical protein